VQSGPGDPQCWACTTKTHGNDGSGPARHGCTTSLVVHGADGPTNKHFGESKYQSFATAKCGLYLTPEDFGVKAPLSARSKAETPRKMLAVIRTFYMTKLVPNGTSPCLTAAWPDWFAGGKARTLREGIDLARNHPVRQRPGQVGEADLITQRLARKLVSLLDCVCARQGLQYTLQIPASPWTTKVPAGAALPF